MTAIVYDLPGPPEGQEWCSGCVLLLRGRLDKEYNSLAVELGKDGKDDVRLIRPDRSLIGRLRVAVVSAPFGLAPQLGMMRLCWTCSAGIAPVQVSSLVTGDGMPPGLLRGRG